MLQNILPDSLLPQSLHLPEILSLKTRGKTDMKTGDLYTEMTSSNGGAIINMGLKDNIVDADVDLLCFDLGQLLSLDMLGEVDAKIIFNGNLAQDGLVDFEMPIEVASIDINKKTYWTPKSS
jgi:hypothetical protein